MSFILLSTVEVRYFMEQPRDTSIDGGKGDGIMGEEYRL
jgi:hypothetical protein